MKKKTIFRIVIALIILGFIGYFALSAMFSAPLYRPGDLKTKKEYNHLLEEVRAIDEPNSFNLNNGISLNYFTKGKGKPILVVHGGPGIPYQDAWKGLNSLTSTCKFYYYDQRGCGKSTRPFDKFETNNFYKNMMTLNENLGLPAQIADIEQVRKKLGVEKLTIIGHSFGGFIASLYAIEFPENVERLILVAPAEVVKLPSKSGGLYEIIEERLPADGLKEYQNYLEEVLDFKNIFKKSEKDLVELNKRFIKYYNLATNKSISESEVEPQIGGWLQNAVFLSMGKKHDYSKDLQKIRAPTLIIHGEEDIIPVSSVQLYLDNIPNSRLETIPNSTHFPFNEQAELFGNIVIKELK